MSTRRGFFRQVAAAAVGLMGGSAMAAENPFVLLDQEKDGSNVLAEAKCGTGKCGANNAKPQKKCGGNEEPARKCGANAQPAKKCGTGKCGANNAQPAKKCGGTPDAKKCGGEKPAKKCGASQ